MDAAQQRLLGYICGFPCRVLILDREPIQVLDSILRNRGAQYAFQKLKHHLHQLSGVGVSRYSELVIVDHPFELLDRELIGFPPGLLEVLAAVHLGEAREDLRGRYGPTLEEHFELSEDRVDDVRRPPDDLVWLDGADKHLRGDVLFERESRNREENPPVFLQIWVRQDYTARTS